MKYRERTGNFKLPVLNSALLTRVSIKERERKVRIKMTTTIKDIAREVGVSHATVSYVLNKKADEKGVSEETKKRILAMAKGLNYRRNIIARSLVTRKSKVIGLLIPCVTYSFWSQFARSVEDASRENGYHVLLCHMNDDWQREIDEIDLLREYRVAGLIVAPAYDRPDTDIYLRLQDDKVNFVLVDQHLNGLECNFVGTDDKAGAYEAVTYLIKLGHRRVAYINGPRNAPTAQGRLRGYRDALADNNIAFDPELVEGDRFKREDGYKTAKKLLESGRKPTAFFAVTDMVAIGAMQAIKERGLRVPEDISVVGFADNEAVSIMEPPLTTVRQPIREMGRAAVRIILDETEGKKWGENGIRDTEKIILKPTLVIRKSCGAIT